MNPERLKENNYHVGMVRLQQIRAGAGAYPSHGSQVVTETGYQDAPPDYLIIQKLLNLGKDPPRPPQAPDLNFTTQVAPGVMAVPGAGS